MKKLFLLTLALSLLWAWTIAGAGDSQKDMTSNVLSVEKKAPVSQVDRQQIVEEKEALKQETLKQFPIRVVTSDAPRTSSIPEIKTEKIPHDITPSVPDQNLILQGGDDCANATVIDAIPYSNTGTTVGYTDDYDASCPSTSTSPDVVYSYSPTADICVDISLCGNSAYDTKLFVYENDCSTAEIACNDDYCETPSYPDPFVSQINGLNMVGGNTYYIVVDGWNGDAGAYTIDITECPTIPDDICPDNTIYSNGLPDGGNIHATQCDVPGAFEAEVADDFVLDADATINGIQYWAGFWNADPYGTPVDWEGLVVTIYNDNAGIPGGNHANDCSISGDYVWTGTFLPGEFGYRNNSGGPQGPWEITVAVPGVDLTAGTTYWLGVMPIMQFGLAGQAGWFRTTSQAGSGAQLYSNYFGYAWEAVWGPVDVGFCLLPDTPCFDEVTIEIMTDNYPEETTWDIVDHTTGEVYASGGPYSGQPNTLITETYCGSADLCYDFIIYDAYGDGICCDWGDGYYNVYFNGELRGTGGDFGDSETVYGFGRGCVACVVECPEGSTPEGEPDCSDGYVDDYNAGCNEDPNNFSSVSSGETICGTSGYYVRNDTTMRDTDWYELTVTEATQITMMGCGEMPYQQLIITPGPEGTECDDLSIDWYTQTAPCDTGTIVAVVEAGTYWLWAGAYDNGVDPLSTCGDTYWFSVATEPAPLGACCDLEFNCIGDYNQFECADLGGAWYAGETCADFTCPYPRQVGLATTDNIPDVGVSNYGPLGETDTQGNTCNWNGNGAVNFAGTFVMGNSSTTMFSYYNPGVTDCWEYTATDFLNMDDTFHPTGEYNDSGILGGLTINYCGHGFDADNPPAEAGNIFVHVFTVTNNGDEAVDNYYAGIYFDWDIGSTDYIQFDRDDNLMIQGPDETYQYGMCLINADEVGLTSMGAISQNDYIYPSGPSGGGWRQEDLYMVMSSGTDQIWDEQFTDMSSVMSSGPHTINPGESISFKFAVIGGAATADIIADAQLAATLEIDDCSAGAPCGNYVIGDWNGSLQFNVADIIAAFGKLKGQPNEPALLCECPPGSGNIWAVAMDVNGNCAFNLADIIWGFGKLKGQPNVLTACPACPPGSPSPRGGDEPLVVPNLKSKAKISTGQGMD